MLRGNLVNPLTAVTADATAPCGARLTRQPMTFSENVQQPGAGMLGEPPAAPRESVAEWWVGGAGPAGRTCACPSACSSCVDGKNSNMSCPPPSPGVMPS
jgi:hypothetical protein